MTDKAFLHLILLRLHQIRQKQEKSNSLLFGYLNLRMKKKKKPIKVLLYYDSDELISPKLY